MVEVREAGKTGEYGWTEKAGFSHYVAKRHAKDSEQTCTGDCPAGSDDEAQRKEPARRRQGSRAAGRHLR